MTRDQRLAKIFAQIAHRILKKEAAEAVMVGDGIRNNGQQEPMLIHEQKTIKDGVKERKC